MSLSDIAAFAFGPGANTVVAVLFSLELLTVCTSLVIVTADTLAELFPHHTHHKKKMIKAVIAAIFTVTTLWKRRTPATGGSPRKWGWIMGVVSLTGVVTIVNMVGIVLFEGLIKAERPGSLWDWEETRLAPSVGIVGSFMSAGLFIVNLDAHAVFAGTYRDLKEPKDFPRVINRAYMLNVSVYILLGVAAYLMYGSHVMPEITANLPRDSFAVVTLVLIAVNPFTKYALLLRPVTAQLEAAFPAMFGHHDERGATYRTTPLGRLRGPLLRIALGLLVLGVSIAFPSFVRIIGLMGSLFSFGLAVVLPSLCHLEILGSRGLLGFMDGLVSVLLVVCGTVLAIGGTWASVVPYK
ncbi:hypothetical protein HK101_002001 [Irineochytrium annulatum]|nr:hypothetical protein HK101_002001 [Irineochytrium annulatum]